MKFLPENITFKEFGLEVRRETHRRRETGMLYAVWDSNPSSEGNKLIYDITSSQFWDILYYVLW